MGIEAEFEINYLHQQLRRIFKFCNEYQGVSGLYLDLFLQNTLTNSADDSDVDSKISEGEIENQAKRLHQDLSPPRKKEEYQEIGTGQGAFTW